MPDPVLPDKKKFDALDPNPCSGCSQCCQYVALQIDTPTTLKEFDNILWSLVHKDIWVYIDEHDDWYTQFNTPCKKLDGMRCGYYANRPQMCRDYSPSNCARYGDEEHEKALFKNEGDLFRYLGKRRPAMLEKMAAKIGLPEEYAALLTDARARRKKVLDRRPKKLPVVSKS